MTILSSLPFIGSFFSNKSTSDGLRKGIQPLSAALKQGRHQPYSRHAKTIATSSKVAKVDDPITEYNILNNFPRPNLVPTLQLSTLFGLTNSPPDMDNQRQPAIKCSSCSGPHRTDFCPC
ncbi:hypothetical protein BC940DRAFT_322272 [Gongronella butleri]|nr:hypothetical protein BC940DRAFT_322272 [Gongronella butleri]